MQKPTCFIWKRLIVAPSGETREDARRVNAMVYTADDNYSARILCETQDFYDRHPDELREIRFRAVLEVLGYNYKGVGNGFDYEIEEAAAPPLLDPDSEAIEAALRDRK